MQLEIRAAPVYSRIKPVYGQIIATVRGSVFLERNIVFVTIRYLRRRPCWIGLRRERWHPTNDL